MLDDLAKLRLCLCSIQLHAHSSEVLLKQSLVAFFYTPSTAQLCCRVSRQTGCELLSAVTHTSTFTWLDQRR